MKKCIAYYSKQGNSKKLAKAFAEKFGFDMIELVDPSKYKGIFGFLKAGFSATRKKSCILSKEVLDELSNYELIYLASPVWASTFTPAINAIFKSVDIAGKKIGVMTVQGDQNISNHDLRKATIYQLIVDKGGEFLGLYSFVGSGLGKGCFDQKVFDDQISKTEFNI